MNGTMAHQEKEELSNETSELPHIMKMAGMDYGIFLFLRFF